MTEAASLPAAPGARPIEYRRVGTRAIFQGDMVLGLIAELHGTAAPRAGAASAPRHGSALLPDTVLWPSGVIPYLATPTLGKERRGRVAEAIEHVEEKTGLRFPPHAGEKNHLAFRRAAACRSRVGMVGGRQYVDVSRECDFGNLVHEICHALGLWHEHARPDRDRYIRLVKTSVRPGAWKDFSQKGGDFLAKKPYDYESIMHYPRDAYVRADGLVTIEPIPVSGAPQPVGDPKKMGQRDGLSEYDVKTIRTLYG